MPCHNTRKLNGATCLSTSPHLADVYWYISKRVVTCSIMSAIWGDTSSERRHEWNVSEMVGDVLGHVGKSIWRAQSANVDDTSITLYDMTRKREDGRWRARPGRPKWVTCSDTSSKASCLVDCLEKKKKGKRKSQRRRIEMENRRNNGRLRERTSGFNFVWKQKKKERKWQRDEEMAQDDPLQH